MGNILDYPPHLDAKRREKRAARQANSLRGGRTVVLPDTSFTMSTRTANEVSTITLILTHKQETFAPLKALIA